MKLMDILKEAFQSPEDAIACLEKLASTGKMDNDAIRDLSQRLISARRKMFAAKRSPDSYKAAADKAKATRAQGIKDREAFLKKADRMDATQQRSDNKRRSKNLLPLTTDDYSGSVSSRFYDVINRRKDPGGFFRYDLKPEYKNTPVSKAIADKYWGA